VLCIIHDWAEKAPDSTAVIYNGRRVSYAEFAARINSMRSFLQPLDLAPGQVAIVRIENLVDAWAAYFARRELGLSTLFVQSKDTAERLELSNVGCIVTTQMEQSRLPLDTTPWPNATVVVLPSANEDTVHLKSSATAEHNTPKGRHILYTSCTTVASKRLCFTSEMLEASNQAGEDEFTAKSVFHCTLFSLWTGVGFKFPLRLWTSGGCVIFDQRPDWCR